MLYTLRFLSSKCSLLHNSNVFGSCIIHILYTGCAKIKKKNSGAKRLQVEFLTVVNINSKTFRVVLSQSRYQYFWVALFQPVGQDSSVIEVTCYRLNAAGIKSRWWQDFPHPSRMPMGHSELPLWWVLWLFPRGKVAGACRWGTLSCLYDGYCGCFPGVKWPGRGINHPPLSNV